MPHIRIHIKYTDQSGACACAKRNKRAAKNTKIRQYLGHPLKKNRAKIAAAGKPFQTSHQAKKKGAGNACAFHNFD